MLKYGFIKAATVSPMLKIADPEYNTEIIIKEIKNIAKNNVDIAVFPELALTSASCGELFRQRLLIKESISCLEKIANATKSLNCMVVIGFPFEYKAKLYNCAAVISGGNILGIIPKSDLLGCAESYESRYFTSGADIINTFITLSGKEIPFGNDVIFRCQSVPELVIGVEIGSELYSLFQPSQYLALNGATVICNPCSVIDSVGRYENIKNTVMMQSKRLMCAYMLSNSSEYESSTDATYCGYSVISENGKLLIDDEHGGCKTHITDIDIDRLVHDRMKNNTFESRCDYREVLFDLEVNEDKLTREISPFPFIPSEEKDISARCAKILDMQSAALKKRVEHIGCKNIVVGISGGLDSCLALLVMAMAMDKLGRARSDVIAVTMPCFGTTKRTANNAKNLCSSLGVSFKEIDITNAVLQHFEDIGQDKEKYDVTYENCQARERTQVLMDVANKCGGIVIGTGDLSELALGWATYNGDHMSMYGVNAGIPKTLIRLIVKYYADICNDRALSEPLYDILDTPVSPELIPSTDGSISQVTEDIVGPYELHDFYLYYHVRYGFEPKKILYLAQNAFDGKYDTETIKKWLSNFYRRFASQQFKRSCLPDGPKIGSVSLSPRGDWKMPSDASADLWKI